MTNQVQGEILFEGWGGGGDSEWVYTPWMPVESDFALFAVEVCSIVSGVTLQWQVQTRVRESSTASLGITTPETVTVSGIASAVNDATLKELFRYRFATATASPSKTKFVVVRALPPSWEIDR